MSEPPNRQREQELAQDLREMANALSHDLRAPLRAIDGFSRALSEECRPNISARGQEYLKWIVDAAQGMARQIEALVALGRLSTADLRWQTVDLSLLALQVSAGLQATDPGRTVQVTIAPGLMIPGDERLLGLVLDQLFQNAWTFTRDSPRPQVTLGREDRPEGTAFFVRDNGIGFENNQVERLFQPFSRLHSPDQAPVGLGVGLCKARRAVTRMGGRIWAEGKPGQGATVYFTVGSPPG